MTKPAYPSSTATLKCPYERCYKVVNSVPADTVDKPTRPTYYFPIMATDRIQRQIDRLLDEAEDAFDQVPSAPPFGPVGR